MKRSERVFCLVMVGVAVAFLVGSLRITSLRELSLTAPGGYPVFIACLGLVFVGWIVLESRSGAGQPSDGREEAQEVPEEEPPVLHRDVLVMMGILVGYLIAVRVLHYTVATLLFTFASILYLRRSWKLAALVSYISTFLILLVFKYLFSVILP